MLHCQNMSAVIIKKPSEIEEIFLQKLGRVFLHQERHYFFVPQNHSFRLYRSKGFRHCFYNGALIIRANGEFKLSGIAVALLRQDTFTQEDARRFKAAYIPFRDGLTIDFHCHNITRVSNAFREQGSSPASSSLFKPSREVPEELKVNYSQLDVPESIKASLLEYLELKGIREESEPPSSETPLMADQRQATVRRWKTKLNGANCGELEELIQEMEGLIKASEQEIELTSGCTLS